METEWGAESLLALLEIAQLSRAKTLKCMTKLNVLEAGIKLSSSGFLFLRLLSRPLYPASIGQSHFRTLQEAHPRQ